MKRKKNKRPSARSELDRIYMFMEELEPTDEMYALLLERANKLETAYAKHREARLSPANLVGNGTTVLTSLLAYWHEDVLGRLPTKGLARNQIPKSQIR